MILLPKGMIAYKAFNIVNPRKIYKRFWGKGKGVAYGMVISPVRKGKRAHPSTGLTSQRHRLRQDAHKAGKFRFGKYVQ
jgi:hypothetical protein